MSERDEFDAWAEPQGILLGRVVSDERYESMTTEWAYRAWQAARAPQAVPALTVKQRAAVNYAILAINSKPGWAGGQTDELRALLAAAPQPSQEPEKAVEPAHEHYWGYFTDTKTYRCRCGAEQAQYPFGPADYKD